MHLVVQVRGIGHPRHSYGSNLFASAHPAACPDAYASQVGVACHIPSFVAQYDGVSLTLEGAGNLQHGAVGRGYHRRSRGPYYVQPAVHSLSAEERGVPHSHRRARTLDGKVFDRRAERRENGPRIHGLEETPEGGIHPCGTLQGTFQLAVGEAADLDVADVFSVGEVFLAGNGLHAVAEYSLIYLSVAEFQAFHHGLEQFHVLLHAFILLCVYAVLGLETALQVGAQKQGEGNVPQHGQGRGGEDIFQGCEYEVGYACHRFAEDALGCIEYVSGPAHLRLPPFFDVFGRLSGSRTTLI